MSSPGASENLVSQQPQSQAHLTPQELEQLRETKKWAEIRKERRAAAGLPLEDGSLAFSELIE